MLGQFLDVKLQFTPEHLISNFIFIRTILLFEGYNTSVLPKSNGSPREDIH